VPGHIPNAPVEYLTKRINTIENVLTRMENKLDDVRVRLAENQQNLKNIEADESRSEQPLP
jgi:prefoldin subunit 5